MHNFNPPWARDNVTKRSPTSLEDLNGFQCGPVERDLFNGIINRIEYALQTVGIYASGGGTAAHATNTLLSTLAQQPSQMQPRDSVLNNGVFTIGAEDAGVWSLELWFNTPLAPVTNTTLSFMQVNGSRNEQIIAQASASSPAGRTSMQTANRTLALEAGDTVTLFGRQYNGSSNTQGWDGVFTAFRVGTI